MNVPRLAYYPGCSGQGSSREYDLSTRVMCADMDLELIDIPDWSCCGATPAHAVDHLLSASLVARNMAIAEEMGVSGIVTPCPSCLKNFKSTQRRMRRPDFHAAVEKLLGRSLRADLPVMSVLQVVAEQGVRTLPDRIKNPLTGLKVVPYYGCLMNRPPDVMAFDDPENPMALDNLLLALGAEVLPFPLKVECCGASLGVTKRQIVMRLSGRILDCAETMGAQAVVTACPMCQMNLDMRQAQVNRANQSNHHIPVFYYSQLIGLATGLDDRQIGLERLCVSPRPVLASLNGENREARS